MQRSFAILILIVATMLSGCRLLNTPDYPTVDPNAPQLANPLTVPMLDRALIMDEVSDELDNYFRIYKEERIRVVESLMTEGWIETHPKIGGTLLEPWKRDSMPGFEKLHATLQTVRRFSKVRVIPMGGNYQVDVRVYKELEDLTEPQSSTISGRRLRHDNAIDIDQPEIFIEQKNKGWIPMGRDFALEQQILRNIQTRITEVNQQYCQ